MMSFPKPAGLLTRNITHFRSSAQCLRREIPGQKCGKANECLTKRIAATALMTRLKSSVRAFILSRALGRRCATAIVRWSRFFGPSNEAIVKVRTRPLPPRVTADDRNVHRVFVHTLGIDAVWRDLFRRTGQCRLRWLCENKPKPYSSAGAARTSSRAVGPGHSNATSSVCELTHLVATPPPDTRTRKFIRPSFQKTVQSPPHRRAAQSYLCQR
jgi:hypothetical protein